ncbi:cation:proton antiporter [Streptomyces sp. F001]|uniref:cation:proton antiporter n=1 Tax=Streptomyces sp. F001 TaxID=1510026 RepID=UPI0013EE5EA8|nr:cation:proton antiporter [Streptomyces sp. F001]
MSAGVPFLLAVMPRVPLPGPVLEIVAGIVLGPAVLNVVQPDAIVQALSIIGLSFLLFLAGLEIDFQQLRGPWHGSSVWVWRHTCAGRDRRLGLHIAGLVESPLLIGTALVATSLGLLVPILKDADAVDRPVGQLTIGGGSAGEISAVVLLSLFFSEHASGPASRLLLLLGLACLVRSSWWPRCVQDAPCGCPGPW